MANQTGKFIVVVNEVSRLNFQPTGKLLFYEPGYETELAARTRMTVLKTSGQVNGGVDQTYILSPEGKILPA